MQLNDLNKGDLVKGKSDGRWGLRMFDDYGIGIVLASDQLGSAKIYWPKQKFWRVTLIKNVVRV